MAPTESANVLYLGNPVELTSQQPSDLEAGGYRIQLLLSHSVDEAIELCKRSFLHLILISLTSHDDAISACTAIRRVCDRPILLLAEQAEEAKLLDGYTAGADECIALPVSRELLLAKIASWLRWSPASPSPAHLPLDRPNRRPANTGAQETGLPHPY